MTVAIGGQAFDLMPMTGATNDVFITAGLDLDISAGDTLVAEYTDPTDGTDISSDTIPVVANLLVVDAFYVAPSPFDAEVAFGYRGTGIASQMTVAVYDLAGQLVWETAQTDVIEISWDGMAAGRLLANGCYIYVITATDGSNTFADRGKVFVSR